MRLRDVLRPLRNRGFSLLPLCTAPVVDSIFTPAATAFKLLTSSRVLPGVVRPATGNTPGFVSAVSLRVAEARETLSLKRSLRGHVRFHRDSYTALF
jgi:hypothetical protein